MGRRDGEEPAAEEAVGRPCSQPRLLGRGYQGAVYRVDTAQGPVIVKRAMGGALARAARRLMLRRELRIYQLLEGIPGVPRCYGLRHGELVLEYVEGTSLREAQLAPEAREQFFTALLDLIESVHQAGVAHGDLKRKDNILVDAAGRPVLIDFGTAVSAPPGAGWWRRVVFREVRRMDLNAWSKLKYQRRPGGYVGGDQRHFRPTLLERLARIVRRTWQTLTLRRRRKARRTRGRR
jgi:predicted Ser/Thr protein kinase